MNELVFENFNIFITELFTIEFYRTLIAVLIGALISLFSVLIIEKYKFIKELKDRKRATYKGVLSMLNSMKRTEISILQHGIHSRYHKAIYLFDKSDLTKEEGRYHQQEKNIEIANLAGKLEKLDFYLLEYFILKGSDKEFDKWVSYFTEWKRPKIPNYTYKGIETLNNLNDIKEEDVNKDTKYTRDYWDEGIEKFSIYLIEKLL